jgi:hypothetical protein
MVGVPYREPGAWIRTPINIRGRVGILVMGRRRRPHPARGTMTAPPSTP